MDMYVFNIKLPMTNEDLFGEKEENYITLFERIFNNDRKNDDVKVFGDRKAFFKNREWDDKERIYTGSLMRYTKIDADGNWVDIVEKNYTNKPDLNKNIHPNANVFYYMFFPKLHRLFLDTNFSGAKFTLQFLEKSFKSVLSDNDDVHISMEVDAKSINNIINHKDLKYIKITYTYTNSDAGEMGNDLAELLDTFGKDIGAGLINSEIKTPRNKHSKLKPLISTLYGKGMAMLAQKNGKIFAKTSTNEELHTDNSPRKIRGISTNFDFADVDRLKRSIADYDGKED